MIAIYTNELIESRKRRMPWRTVLEVARHLGAVVFSGDGKAAGTEIGSVRVEYVDKPFSADSAQALADKMKELGVARLYFPVVPGRTYGELQKACDAVNVEVVWYITSSWNSFGRVFRAWKWLGFKAARPYLVQALMPKRAWIKRLNARRVRPIVTMSNFTARKLVECNYPEELVHPIIPGLDEIEIGDNATSYSTQGNIPYFLFFGPPQKIRGIYLILEAVKRLSLKRQDFRFVALVRADENAAHEVEELRDAISKMHCDLVEAHFGIASPAEINGYIDGALAVLKPFVLVPSEIPLAPMEAMRRGKMVIGFEGDGTGEIISEQGIAVNHCSVDALGRAMEDVLDCRLGNLSNCKRFKRLNWRQVADKWRSV